jgi:hypothetical protein
MNQNLPVRNALSVLMLLAIGCSNEPTVSAEPATESGEGSSPAGVDARGEDDSIAASPLTERRIVAVGDVHGDYASALEAMQLAGAVDASGQWIGGDLIVVQVGDQTDRGDDERQIIDWFEDLQVQAAAVGGEFHPMLGNHEIMNVQLDLRYVTSGGFEDFADVPFDPNDPLYANFDESERGRVAAFRPGGPYALALSDHPVVLQLGDNVFVHGGLIPRFARAGVDTINNSVAAWMRGEAAEPDYVEGDDCPIWSRHFSSETDAEDCELLELTLEILGAERMIVAHTVQAEGITSECDGKVWRVDVGLSDYYGGTTQVLEIVGDEVRALR